jgi:indolepyruvate ferredoxin oxidoreductase beta subunit
MMVRKKGGRRPIKVQNLVLAGVGGQGILLAGRVLCQAAMEEGNEVNAFEMHGMAQRGGAVLSQIRWGKEVHSSLILEGEADLIIALEPVEALRRLSLVGKGTTTVVNDRTIPPITVSSVPGAEYPTVKKVSSIMKRHVKKFIVVEGTRIAENLGNPAFLSTVMLGAAWGTRRLPLKKGTLLKVVEELVPDRFLQQNLSAFEAGRKMIR